MRSQVLLCVAVAVLLLMPGPVGANTVGIAPGDSMTFAYQILTTYLAVGGNVTNIQNNQFTVNILSVNQSAGDVGYTVSISEFNSTTETNSSLTAPSPENLTTIFNPFDNYSYLGNIGFWPFTYTDLKAGNATNLELDVTITGVPVANGSIAVHSRQHVNATVARSPGLIDVNLTILAFAGSHPSTDALRFNSTTGVMEYSREDTDLFADIQKVFTYTLVSYTKPAPLNLWFVPVLAVAVIAIIAVLTVVRRKSPRERKGARMRERLG